MYKSIYVPYYFYGENDFSILKTRKPDLYISITEALQSGTVEKILKTQKGLNIDDLNIDNEPIIEEYHNLLNKLYPEILPEELDDNSFQTIIELQYEIGTEKEVADELFEYAHYIHETSSGDDSYYDYDPDAIITLGILCGRLGFKEMQKELIDLGNSHED